jgi:glycogen debranching enzyme
MNELIRLPDEFYILATASAAEESRVLKMGESFGIFDRYGDILQYGLGEQGIYHEGTRFLSYLELRLGNIRPFLLSSMIKEDNVLFTVDLTNPDVYVDGTVALRRGDLHLYRSKFIWQAVCYERLELVNYSLSPVEISFAIRFDADFADIFEVRGVKREKRGRRLEDEIDANRVTLSYLGLDDIVRQTIIEFSPAPDKLASAEASFHRVFDPKKHEAFLISYACKSNHFVPVRRPVELALKQAEQALSAYKAEECQIRTSNHEFNGWLDRSYADIHMMITDSQGLYPYAGVPWFSTVFGRDGILTSWELLWVFPRVARGVLTYLAEQQATEIIFERDAEPGKILHEMRRGEMASLGEIPFNHYYGSTDSTPLFVMLAGAYVARTNDVEFARWLWPHVKRALRWIEEYGDIDGDGFVETLRRSSHGLVQQGWKDSWDSVFYQDGTLTEAPLALCEVQGYVYAAKHAAAEIARLLGHSEEAVRFVSEAELLKKQFNQVFWCDELSTYVLALDQQKRPCRVRASNAGHCLFAGIATDEYAARTAKTLMSEDFFSGWGIRTLSANEARYNPMSYHNGSVWPHDNAVIAAGFARYGLKEPISKVITGLFEASIYFEMHRLPELFCGFPRRKGEGPTLYPVACAPQAWAAGSVFLMLQACLGLSVHASEGKVHFDSPVLPECINQIHLKNLRIDPSLLDLVIDRTFQGIGVERRQGDVSIVIS